MNANAQTAAGSFKRMSGGTLGPADHEHRCRSKDRMTPAYDAHKGACSITVKIEAVSVQVYKRELPQTPGLFLQRLHDL